MYRAAIRVEAEFTDFEQLSTFLDRWAAQVGWAAPTGTSAGQLPAAYEGGAAGRCRGRRHRQRRGRTPRPPGAACSRGGAARPTPATDERPVPRPMMARMADAPAISRRRRWNFAPTTSSSRSPSTRFVAD